jgi:signal transduction histidine kinase
MAVLMQMGEGVTQASGLDGVQRLYAFSPLIGAGRDPGAYVSVGIPIEAAFADSNQALARNLIALSIVATLTLALTWVTANRLILRQVDALVRATRGLSAGDLTARTGIRHAHGELYQLARAFDEMAASLERAQQQRRLEEKLRRENFELEQQNRGIQETNHMMSEFVSMVSHEMRTPLTSIQGYAELLLDGDAGDLTKEQRDFLRTVRSNSDRLLALINGLLDLARVESGRIELERSAVELEPLVQSVARSLRPLISAKQQQLALELAGNLPPVWADADRLTQILTNLISNAHKYTPTGGSIRVKAREQGSQVWIDVSDTGVGLLPEEQDQLFTRFFRARNRATRQVSGTGLGLAITRSLIELHGGDITVESRPGQGSTFSFYLPAAPRDPSAAESSARSSFHNASLGS